MYIFYIGWFILGALAFALGVYKYRKYYGAFQMNGESYIMLLNSIILGPIAFIGIYIGTKNYGK